MNVLLLTYNRIALAQWHILCFGFSIEKVQWGEFYTKKKKNGSPHPIVLAASLKVTLEGSIHAAIIKGDSLFSLCMCVSLCVWVCARAHTRAVGHRFYWFFRTQVHDKIHHGSVSLVYGRGRRKQQPGTQIWLLGCRDWWVAPDRLMLLPLPVTPNSL